jgi:hypothetical protein
MEYSEEIEKINRVWIKFYDEGQDVEIPAMPVYRVLDNMATKYPDKVTVTYASILKGGNYPPSIPTPKLMTQLKKEKPIGVHII